MLLSNLIYPTLKHVRTFISPGKIIFGVGATHDLVKETRRLGGSRPLIVTYPEMAVVENVRDVTKAFESAGLCAGVYMKAEPYCNIDYDREIAIVVEVVEEGRRKIVGVVRLVIDPRGKRGEFAVVVADPWQGLGIGTKMVDHLIGIAEDKNLERIDGIVLSRNTRMLDLCRKIGFQLRKRNHEEVQVTLGLSGRPQPDQGQASLQE